MLNCTVLYYNMLHTVCYKLLHSWAVNIKTTSFIEVSFMYNSLLIGLGPLLIV